MSSPDPIESLDQFDDQDVELLYDIVRLARKSSHLPVRALFEAHDAILSRAGVDTRHHSRFLNFLLHASSELAVHGTRGLLRQFNALLERADIKLVHDEGEGGSDLVELSHGQDLRNAQEELDRRHVGADSSRQRRRASFNDSNLDTTWISGDRLPVHGDRHVRAVSNEAQGSAAPTPAPRLRSISSARGEDRYPGGDTIEPLLTWTGRPDRHRLAAEAAHFRLHILVRKRFLLWQARAVQLNRRYRDLSHMANDHDKRTLLQQSLSSLRIGVLSSRVRQQRARRAVRAKDMFLMAKALTHWAQSASDEKVRTAVAQRHILRTRYFNAWRDISEANDLYCRRIGVRRWFNVWRVKSVTRQWQEAQAQELGRAKLLQRCYRTWLLQYCSRWAPVWKEEKQKAFHLRWWSTKSVSFQAMLLAAVGTHNHRLQERSMMSLESRLSRYRNAELAADAFHRRSLLSSTLQSLRRRTAFRPREVHFIVDYDRRILHKTVHVWRAVTAITRAAHIHDQRRILGNAVTQWNERMRMRTLRRKIDDRVVVQAFYKWALEERFALFVRVMDYRRKATAFGYFTARIAEKRFRFSEAHQIFDVNKRRRTLQMVVTKLHGQTRLEEHEELRAAEFRNARLLSRNLSWWKRRLTHVQELSRWANDGRFYCLSKSTIKKWKEATLERKRQRRREAYATVRRHDKMNLARRQLGKLRDRASEQLALEARAQQIYASKTRAVYLQYFGLWRDHAVRWQGDELTADRTFAQHRIRKALVKLLSCLDIAMEKVTQGAELKQERAERAAGKMTKKLSDSVFSLRRHVDTAEAWQVRKFAQHRRDMLRYWAMQANERRAEKNADDPESPSRTPTLRSSRRLLDATSQSRGLGSTVRAEDWTQFEPLVNMNNRQDAMDQSELTFATTPMPGYLRTPSRRAARSRARLKAPSDRPGATRFADTLGPLDFGSSAIASTTPAPNAPGPIEDMESLTPQVTPFQRKMRAGGYQSSTTPASVTRQDTLANRFGVSTRSQATGRTVRFGEAQQQDFSGDQDG